MSEIGVAASRTTKQKVERDAATVGVAQRSRLTHMEEPAPSTSTPSSVGHHEVDLGKKPRSRIGEEGREARRLKKRKQAENIAKAQAARKLYRTHMEEPAPSTSIPSSVGKKGTVARLAKGCRVEQRLVRAWNARSLLVRELRQTILVLCRQLQQSKDANLRLLKENDALRKRSPIKRTQLDSLKSTSQKRDRIRRLQIGDSLTLSLQKEIELSIASASAFRSSFDLTEKQYAGVRRLQGRKLPPLYQIKRWSQHLVEEADLVDEISADGVRFTFWRRPHIVLTHYLRRLADTHWQGGMPQSVDIIVAGDRGGNVDSNWTKIGMFIPTGVTSAQSPLNFLLMAAYDGKESVENIRQAGSFIFQFLNDLSAAKIFRFEEVHLPVNVLAVGDLKWLPLVVGSPHHASSAFCPVCLVTRQQHLERPAVGVPLRQADAHSLLRIPTANIVIPPLHTLQGCVNTALKALLKTEGADLRRLFAAAKVAPSHQSASLLNGRDCRRFLRFVTDNDVVLRYAHPKTHLEYDLGRVFRAIARLQRWAVAAELNVNISYLRHDIDQLSAAWRASKLPTINKLHLLEAHLADFVEMHRSWGLYGEQGVESLHHFANAAAQRCFGVNAEHRLPYFMKRQLAVAFTDAAEFAPKERRRSGTPTAADDELVLIDEDFDVAYEEVVEWYEDDEI